jgi:hypothetical protein
MKKNIFYRYRIYGLKSRNDTNLIVSKLKTIKGILYVYPKNDLKYIYIEMKYKIEINLLNKKLHPDFKLDDELNYGDLMSFFP